MLSVAIYSVMLNVILQNVIVLNAVMRSVIMLYVVALLCQLVTRVLFAMSFMGGNEVALQVTAANYI